jgi:hypothetical protein
MRYRILVAMLVTMVMAALVSAAHASERIWIFRAHVDGNG